MKTLTMRETKIARKFLNHVYQNEILHNKKITNEQREEFITIIHKLADNEIEMEKEVN